MQCGQDYKVFEAAAKEKMQRNNDDYNCIKLYFRQYKLVTIIVPVFRKL